MKWVFVKYHYPEDENKYVKSHCFPSSLENERNTYIKEKYGVDVRERDEVEEMWIDLGGMICTQDPITTIRLDENRVFSCYSHQVGGVISVLQNAKEHKGEDGVVYWRFVRWPGVLLFITDDDRTKLIYQLLQEENKVDELEHSIKMREALIKANVRDKGPEVEKEVRVMFDKLDGKGEVN